jgi:hypothetical protein
MTRLPMWAVLQDGVNVLVVVGERLAIEKRDYYAKLYPKHEWSIRRCQPAPKKEKSVEVFDKLFTLPRR